MDKVKYELAKASGTLELVRSDEISRLMRQKYGTIATELRISLNLQKDPTNPKFIREFEEHEAYYEECKARVDEQMRIIEASLTEEDK